LSLSNAMIKPVVALTGFNLALISFIIARTKLNNAMVRLEIGISKPHI
jgi:hypothetical protein